MTWRGQLFPRTLHLMNYSVEFPRHYTGGYMVVSAGSSYSRRCVHVWMQLQKQVLVLLLDVVQPDPHTLSSQRDRVGRPSPAKKPSMLFMRCTRLCSAVQVLNNTWRLCHSYVDPACLNERDADMCVFQSIQSMLAAEHQHEPLSGGAIAGIVTGGEHCGCRGH